MSDLNIYYKNNKIFSASADTLENLKTAGTYCEDDIVVEYTKPTLSPLDPNDAAGASDILNGKKAYDDQGVEIDGTLVPPVDTGANGLYKSMIEENVTEIVDDALTSIRSGNQYQNGNLVKLSIPNVTKIGAAAFYQCNITGYIDLSQASTIT